METEYAKLRYKYQQVLEYLTDQQLAEWEERVANRICPECGHEKES